MFSDKCVNNTYICNPEANILSCKDPCDTDDQCASNYRDKKWYESPYQPSETESTRLKYEFLVYIFL
ncbi:hypothetical protein H8356DRAFT_1322550 [Neocallimastix lanati (nom. inval.)]|nr:hypothetical protein H8356DRAFT_1322550 [Neocallimastix sp. JGI-2020a]